jgi:hypothetical protein
MKKTFAIGVVITFTGSLLAIPAFGAAKAGATCTKVGVTSIISGKKYTCVKTTKKLVWNGGVELSSPSALPKPTNTPNPSPSPTLENGKTQDPINIDFELWSSSFSADQMINAALGKTDKFFGKVSPSHNYDLTVSPEISTSDLQWITKMLDYATGSFSNLDRPKMRVFIGTNREWSKNTLKNANIWIGNSDDPYPCSQGLDDAYCSESNLVLLVYVNANSSYFKWDAGRRSTPAHETFHTIQFALSGPQGNTPPESPTHIPRWLKEGSANYFGYYVSDRLGFEKYQVGRTDQVSARPAYRTASPLSSYDNYFTDPYGIGQAASEYLIASIGFENFLNIWKFTSDEQSFSKGFKKATGIEIDDFYSKFEAARSSMKIGTI